MTFDQLQALLEYIDAKCAEAEHAARHGGSVSTFRSEVAREILEAMFSKNTAE